MNLKRIWKRFKPSRRRKKSGRGATEAAHRWPVQPMGEQRVRCGPFAIRYLAPFSFRVLHWEIFVQEAYRFETSRPRPRIVDCGSNIGMSVLYFKHLYPEARITAFEPSPAAFACLRENIAGNQLEDVTAHEVAVGGQEGEVDLMVSSAPAGDLEASTRAGGQDWRRQRVRCVRLSDYIEEPVDYLKVDAEGAELAVLEDLERNGKLDLIDRMGIEYHHHLEPDVDELGRFLSILERGNFGYRISRPPLGSNQPERQHFMNPEDPLHISAYRKDAAREARPG